jgi:hypothetical protein
LANNFALVKVLNKKFFMPGESELIAAITPTLGMLFDVTEDSLEIGVSDIFAKEKEHAT